MQILRLLTARRFRRRAVSTITATAPRTPFYGDDEDEGPFFDIDLSCCSAPASTAGSQAAESSGSESEDSCCAHIPAAATGDLDFVISLHRSRSASPSCEERLFFRGVAPPKFCASEPIAAASSRRYSTCSSRRWSGSSWVALRTLSFRSAKAALYGGRASFSRSYTNARSARLWYGSPDLGDRDVEASRPHSGDVFRRYLSKISSRLRKSRSASAAQAGQSSPPPARRDDRLLEKQDGIASAIAHCKESFHRGTCVCPRAPWSGRRLVPPLIYRSQQFFSADARVTICIISASVSECDTSLLRSRSDPTAAVAS
jgi:hypothetical protein